MKKKLIVLISAMFLLVACNKDEETIKETLIETSIETQSETELETISEETIKETKEETVEETIKETFEETSEEIEETVFENPISEQSSLDDFESKEDYLIYKLKMSTGMDTLKALSTGNEVNINGINASEFQVYEDMSDHIVTYGYYAVDNAGIIYVNDIITNQWNEI